VVPLLRVLMYRDDVLNYTEMEVSNYRDEDANPQK